MGNIHNKRRNAKKEESSEAQNNQRTDYFGSLPDEVLLEIMKKRPKLLLRPLTMVCRRFYRIIQDRSLWEKVVITDTILDSFCFGDLMRRPIFHLGLCDVEIPSLLTCGALKDTYPSWPVQEMHFLAIEINPDDLIRIVKKCNQLKRLDWEDIEVNDGVLVALSEIEDIETVGLSDLKGLITFGMEFLLRKAKTLEEFHYDNGQHLSFDSICENLSPNLVYLSLPTFYKSDTLRDRHIAIIVKNCPLLQSLDVSQSWGLTAKSIELIRNLKHVFILMMKSCRNIPLAAFVPLIEMENLEELDIRHRQENSKEINELFGVNNIMEQTDRSHVGTIATKHGVVKLTY